MRIVKYILSFLLLFVAADTLVFREGIYLVPNETAWETEPFYNFESTLRALRRKEQNEFRIIIAGSSLGLYGLLPARMEARLNAAGFVPGKNVRVYLLAHQGMHGLELAALSRRYLDAKPDLILLPVNMVDLRLERPSLTGLIAKLNGAERERSLALLRQDLIGMYAVLPLARTGLALEYWSDLTAKQRAQLFFQEISEAYRVKGFYEDALFTFVQNRTSRGRSYDHYAGLDATDYKSRSAVSQRGWVIPDFTIEATDPILRRGLDLEIAASQANVRLTGSRGQKQLTFARGWHTVDVSDVSGPGGSLRIHISPGEFVTMHADMYGARLARNAGLKAPVRSMSRPRRREDSLYENVTDEEYRASFKMRILAFERPGWEYLRALYDAKVEWSKRPFDAGLPAVEGLNRFREHAGSSGVPLFLFNFPENPITLSLYADSNFYRGYLSFLAEGQGKYHFADVKSLLPMQRFYDYHHLTYGGAEILSDYACDWIIRESRSPRR